jgi:hypothetical protein
MWYGQFYSSKKKIIWPICHAEYYFNISPHFGMPQIDKFCFTTPSKEVIGGEFSLKKKHFDMIFSNLFLVKEVLFIFFVA